MRASPTDPEHVERPPPPGGASSGTLFQRVPVFSWEKKLATSPRHPCGISGASAELNATDDDPFVGTSSRSEGASSTSCSRPHHTAPHRAGAHDRR